MKNAIKVICFVLAVILIGAGTFYFVFKWGKTDFETTDGLKDGTVTISSYIGDSVNIVIPNKIRGKKVVGIDKNAFKKTDIESVKLNEYITSIGESCFESCPNLESVDLSNVQALGNRCLSDCPKLEKVTIPETVVKLGDLMFGNDAGLKEVTFESDEHFKIVDDIIYSSDMTTLYETLPYATFTSYTVPDTVTVLNSGSFSFNKKIKSITLGKNVKKISESTFIMCESLTDVKLNNTAQEIGALAFSGTGITSITIPKSIIKIDDNAFYKLEDKLTIRTTANSNAEYFAKEKGFKYEIVK